MSFRYSRQESGFSLIEVLLVIMLISAGILPIYSLIQSGQKRIIRADAKTLATLYGASAVELARTLGYDRIMQLKSDKIDDEKDYKELIENAKKNGFDVIFNKTLQALPAHVANAKPIYLLRVEFTIKSTHRIVTDSPVLKFVAILTDPRFNFY